MSNKSKCTWLFTLLITCSAALGQGDPDTIDKIIDEGKNNSKVWDHLTYLSEEIGVRLTGSTRKMQANTWMRDMFRDFGLSNVHLDKWGEIAVRFDRGPSYAKMVSPTTRDFEFTTRAWGAGTDGPVRGKVIKQPVSLGDIEAMQGELEGAWVLTKQPARRRRRRGGGGGGGAEGRGDREAAREQRQQITQALKDAGIAGRIFGARSDLVITSSVRGWRDLDYNDLPSDVEIIISRIDYDTMNSRIADGEEVEFEADLQNNFAQGPFPVFNTIAEIPGTEWPEQVVIVSGHLDSWDGPGSTATQDNGTGSCVTLEAARILMAAGAKPKRTIRFILWGGEEQGLLGSRAYVKALSNEEKANISVVLVDDGGTNYEGGVSCIASQEPMLAAAIAPVQEAFPDLPMELDIREKMSRFGGSDHAPFVKQGIPGFFWMESGSGGREGKNYRFIHHTQHDTLRYAVPEYLVQSSVCAAVTAYNLACADTLLPREVKEEELVAEAQPEEPWDTTIGPVSGKWSAHMTSENAPDATFTFTLEMSTDGRVRGSVDSEFVDGKISNTSFDPATNKIKFTLSSNMGEIVYQATVSGEEITGKLGIEDAFSSDFIAKRVKEENIAEALDATGDSGVSEVSEGTTNLEEGAKAAEAESEAGTETKESDKKKKDDDGQ
ncbi:MAG: M20/M25/M40 family metallo-hydrolase [Planctomycetes bacterium]|nr:M20/M25/M40 family metallo-hydrolase [Planctomycetota bacterium]